jgi:hypothetical protein
MTAFPGALNVRFGVLEKTSVNKPFLLLKLVPEGRRQQNICR